MIPYKTDTDISSYIIFPRFLIPLDLSNDAKVLYALLLDRAGISKKKGYIETDGTIRLYFTVEDATLPGVLVQSWHTCGYFARAVWSGLGMLVSGQVGLNDMSGPVGIVSYLGEAGSQGGSVAAGLQNVVYIIALIAVNLAIMNLLPLPALDGGRIFLLLVGAPQFYLPIMTPLFTVW